jgi:TATA-binding protein-associated factor Taf7
MRGFVGVVGGGLGGGLGEE